MEKLRFIADTDWQSNVDGRPSISLQIAFTIYFNVSSMKLSY